MKTLTEDAFLEWATTKGLWLAPDFPEAACLVYQSTTESRFWSVPKKPERRPYFLMTLLDLMDDWQSCYVWRHMGSWPDPDQFCHERINDSVEFRILKGLGLPLGTASVVEFSRDERDMLVALLFSTTVFGWSVGDDLYVVPDHARYILQTDHHGVVHAEFANCDDLRRSISKMSDAGFDLPRELPDPTFRSPDWMSGDTV